LIIKSPANQEQLIVVLVLEYDGSLVGKSRMFDLFTTKKTEYKPESQFRIAGRFIPEGFEHNPWFKVSHFKTTAWGDHRFDVFINPEILIHRIYVNFLELSLKSIIESGLNFLIIRAQLKCQIYQNETC